MTHESFPRARLPRAVLLSAAIGLSACAGEAPPDARLAAPSGAGAAEVIAKLVVHKSPYCGCCGSWVEHMRHAGFEVEVREVDDLVPIKQALGVPAGAGSCHSAEIDGYFIEGHVPAEDVRRLLAKKPAARGLAVPGMPLGSPGMEAPDGRVRPYEVLLVTGDGSTSVYARHGE